MKGRKVHKRDRGKEREKERKKETEREKYSFSQYGAELFH